MQWHLTNLTAKQDRQQYDDMIPSHVSIMQYEIAHKRDVNNWVILYFLFFLALFFFLPANSIAEVDSDTNAHNSQKLDSLRQQIADLRKTLEQVHEQHTDVHLQLTAIEKRISTQVRLLRKTNKQISLQKSQLEQLRKRQSQLSKNLDLNNDDLIKQVRANYILGQQQYLKLLLNQKNPATVSRTLVYYDYFNKARVQHITTITADLAEIQRVTRQITSTKKELELVQKNQLEDKQTLEQSRSERKVILARLNQDIAVSDTRLQQLIDDEQELLALLRKLNLQPAKTDENIIPKPFHQQQGQLAWPTNGKVIIRFGSKRNSGDLQWKGVLIQAPQGSDVKAISYGHVIYANWLRGFGLLMIVDHGDGYMSLYGHNESLYKDIGEWVEPNEIIASVGSSGGNTGSGLYFEIRHNGKPTNPIAWLKK